MTERGSSIFPRIINPNALPLNISHMFDSDEVTFRFDLSDYIRDLTDQLHSLEEAAVVAVLRSKGWNVSRPTGEAGRPGVTTEQVRDAATMPWHSDSDYDYEAEVAKFDTWLEDETRGGQAKRQVHFIQKILKPDWVRGKVLPRYVGAENDARLRAIQAVLADDLGYNRGNPPGSITLPDADNLSDEGAELVKTWRELTRHDYIEPTAFTAAITRMAEWIERTSEVLTAPFAIDEENLAEVVRDDIDRAHAEWMRSGELHAQECCESIATAANERMHEWLRPYGARIATCPICHEHLGHQTDHDGYSAEWWVDKTIGEHADEYHN